MDRPYSRPLREDADLFTGPDPMLPLTTRQFTRAVHAAAEAAQIKKRVTAPHRWAKKLGRPASWAAFSIARIFPRNKHDNTGTGSR